MEITTKYNIGDKVWAMLLDEPTHCSIETIHSRHSRTHRVNGYYLVPIGSSWGFHASEYEVFPTKEELLKSL
jgi:hypothetical protein